jgi:glycerol-3-phosphate acyltransferase PlsY
MMISKMGLFVAAYFLGSIPTGYWLGLAWKGVDVRSQGSGNLGATNVFRVLGTGAGLCTLALDILKGWLPVFWARHFYAQDLTLAIAVGLIAILGHATSVFVRFRGGKGVATSAGVFAALLPLPTTAAVLAFALVFAATRYVSLGSLFAVLILAVSSFLLSSPPPLAWAAVVVAVFVFWTHRSNIQRLLNGTENRLSWQKKNA